MLESQTPVTLHDDELLAFAREVLVTDSPLRGKYFTECPGCALLVHHSDLDAHPARCQALRDRAAWCAGMALPPLTPAQVEDAMEAAERQAQEATR